jgi:hypothetical protein
MRNLLPAAKYFVVPPQILRITPGALKRGGGGTQDGRAGDPIGQGNRISK